MSRTPAAIINASAYLGPRLTPPTGSWLAAMETSTGHNRHRITVRYVDWLGTNEGPAPVGAGPSSITVRSGDQDCPVRTPFSTRSPSSLSTFPRYQKAR